jgi:uncharacterized membrane protein
MWARSMIGSAQTLDFFLVFYVLFRRVYNTIRAQVMQVAIIRPILAFLAVILYVDGTFSPGAVSGELYSP